MENGMPGLPNWQKYGIIVVGIHVLHRKIFAGYLHFRRALGQKLFTVLGQGGDIILVTGSLGLHRRVALPTKKLNVIRNEIPVKGIDPYTV